MRAYFFINMYMSGPHIGIQGIHAVSALWRKYTRPIVSPPQLHALNNWEDYHKTAICLNGGDHAALQELLRLMADTENPYPWCEFHESESALNGALTAICIVLPDKLYSPVDPLNWPETFTPWDKVFWQIKDKCSLAR